LASARGEGEAEGGCARVEEFDLEDLTGYWSRLSDQLMRTHLAGDSVAIRIDI
jgi:hypothetical protein